MRASDHKSCPAALESHKHCHPASRCLPAPSLQVEAGRVGPTDLFKVGLWLMDVPGGTEGARRGLLLFGAELLRCMLWAAPGPVKGDLQIQ